MYWIYSAALVMLPAVSYFEVQSASLGGGHKLMTADHENIILGVHVLQDVEMIGL